jgi:hypothetical protein
MWLTSRNGARVAKYEKTFVAITSGGSQAMFFKINTAGEESFLDAAIVAIQTATGER